jgi:hypothetical protein
MSMVLAPDRKPVAKAQPARPGAEEALSEDSAHPDGDTADVASRPATTQPA